MNKVTFEGVTFNADWAVTKTQKQFVDHESHTGLTADQLKEAHNLCKAAVKATGQPAAEEPTS